MFHSVMRQLHKNQSRYSYLALLTVAFVTAGNNAFSTVLMSGYDVQNVKATIFPCPVMRNI